MSMKTERRIKRHDKAQTLNGFEGLGRRVQFN